MKKIIISVFFLIALVSCGHKQTTGGVASGVVKEFVPSPFPTIKFVDGREFHLYSMPDNPVEKGNKIEIFYWKKTHSPNSEKFYLYYDSIRVVR